MQAGGCLDGKQHLQLGDKIGADGLKKMLDTAGIGGAAVAAPKGKGKKRKANSGEDEPAKEA